MFRTAVPTTRPISGREHPKQRRRRSDSTVSRVGGCAHARDIIRNFFFTFSYRHWCAAQRGGSVFGEAVTGRNESDSQPSSSTRISSAARPIWKGDRLHLQGWYCSRWLAVKDSEKFIQM